MPLITIFVRHSIGCKYSADEFSKRCDCRKHLRWTLGKKQFRRMAGTRSWAEAENVRRDLADQLDGRPTARLSPAKDLQSCIALFIQDKRVQSVSEGVVKKYVRELDRLLRYCESRNVHKPQGIGRDLLTGFCATWPQLYPSGTTRAKVRERLRSFLRYCYEAEWLGRVPPVPKFKVEESETQPLTPEEYVRLINSVYVAIDSQRDGVELQLKVATFLETMRWTGLAIRDTMTLRRDALEITKGHHRITTKRAKTGTPVSVPIPQKIGESLLALSNGGDYFFWSGNGEPQSATSNWGQRYIAPVFKEAAIVSEGNMVSHRLRDTFAVDLLEKGVPMEELSRLLGHKSIRTTEKHYAKWSKGRQDRVDALVSATWMEKAPQKPANPRTALSRGRNFPNLLQ